MDEGGYRYDGIVEDRCQCHAAHASTDGGWTVMRYVVVGVLMVLLVVPLAAGQSDTAAVPDTGLVSADSPLHPVEMRIDDGLVWIGLRDPADVALKRASEMHELVERDALHPADAERLRLHLVQHVDMAVYDADRNALMDGDTVSVVESLEIGYDILDVVVAAEDVHVDLAGDPLETLAGAAADSSTGYVEVTEDRVILSTVDTTLIVQEEEAARLAHQRSQPLEDARVLLEDVRSSVSGDAHADADLSVQRIDRAEEQMSDIQLYLDIFQERIVKTLAEHA